MCNRWVIQHGGDPVLGFKLALFIFQSLSFLFKGSSSIFELFRSEPHSEFGYFNLRLPDREIWGNYRIGQFRFVLQFLLCSFKVLLASVHPRAPLSTNVISDPQLAQVITVKISQVWWSSHPPGSNTTITHRFWTDQPPKCQIWKSALGEFTGLVFLLTLFLLVFFEFRL